MRALVDQVEQSLASGQYFLSLFTALTLPDIAAALDAPDGLANGQRYVSWYDKWVRPQFAEVILAKLPPMLPPEQREYIMKGLQQPPLDGDACYRFRCSLLHQGTTHHPKSAFSRIIFIEPHTTTNTVHNCILNDALCIDLQIFCREVIAGVRAWLDQVENADPFKTNYEKFVRRYPGGLKPYIAGVPVIG
jgi:hypothetical protein